MEKSNMHEVAFLSKTCSSTKELFLEMIFDLENFSQKGQQRFT